jgi:hypothetical protein
MTKKAWLAFTAVREQYRSLVECVGRNVPELGKYQQNLVNRRPGPAYRVETPVVYNEALDDVTEADAVKLILVADNPGRREQAAENRRYLVGPSGKIAEKFFRDHPELGIDFRKNVLILNKTPVHTPRTAELAELCRAGGKRVLAAVEESQQEMAELLFEFHRGLAPVPVWIIGYSEMKKGGVFEIYTERLRSLYAGFPRRRAEMSLYRHFSMNQFSIDFSRQGLSGEKTEETLKRIGAAYRRRIIGT